MLGYRHGYHAGNLGDVLKHVALLACLRACSRKPTPFVYLDTHAGAGAYRLGAQGRDEHVSGVAALWPLRGRARDALLEDYLNVVATAQPPGWNLVSGPRDYPGSPAIAAQVLRAQDRILVAELHSSEVPRLQREFAGDARVRITHGDGYGLLRASLPPPERRGVVLIDPAYELDDEANRAVDAVHDGLRRFGHGVFLLWAPMRGKARPEVMERGLKRSGARKLWRIALAPDDADSTALGSVVWICNPPYLVDAEIDACFAACAATLNAQARSAWLIGSA